MDKEKNRVFGSSRILGYFSVDVDRNYLSDSSSLRYFKGLKEAPVVLDLNAGFNDVVVSQVNIKKVRIFQWIDENRETIKASPETERLIEPNFVCAPQSLVLFMSAPYTPTTSWNMWAAKWKGTIYIIAAKGFTRGAFDNEEKIWFWSRKFCQSIVSESPEEAPDTTKPVMESETFRCVYQRQFSKHSVLYSANKRAVRSNEVLSDPLPLDKLQFIDLRISKSIEHGGNENSLKRFKYLRWWTNAFLINDDRVLCGFWDNDGIVHQLKTYKTDDLPKLSEGLWDPQKCIDSCETILTKIEENVVNDCDKTIYEIVKKPYAKFEINELEPTEENSVVPEWYKNSMIR